MEDTWAVHLRTWRFSLHPSPSRIAFDVKNVTFINFYRFSVPIKQLIFLAIDSLSYLLSTEKILVEFYKFSFERFLVKIKKKNVWKLKIGTCFICFSTKILFHN